MNCAIYIDADNVSYKSVEEILARANNCNVIIKKIFADWTDEAMKKWAVKARKYGFQGIQCFGNERKQTSDVYMVTDIISDLFNNQFIDMVILATSDIDFTHLCHIIKEKNKKLVIFAPQKSNITNFQELIDLANNEKEVELKYDLERNVKLVSFSRGKIDISFNEKLNKNFIKVLTEKLLAWTGERWIISLSKNEGAKSLHEQILEKKNIEFKK